MSLVQKPFDDSWQTLSAGSLGALQVVWCAPVIDYIAPSSFENLSAVCCTLLKLSTMNVSVVCIAHSPKVDHRTLTCLCCDLTKASHQHFTRQVAITETKQNQLFTVIPYCIEQSQMLFHESNKLQMFASRLQFTRLGNVHPIASEKHAT